MDKKKLNTSETLLLIASELNEEGDEIRKESSGKDPTTLDFIIDTAVAETLFEVARNLIELVEESELPESIREMEKRLGIHTKGSQDEIDIITSKPFEEN